MAPQNVTTTEIPFAVGHKCFTYRGNVIFTWENDILPNRDLVAICSSLNNAYRLGYTTGYKDGINAPRFL